MMDDVVSQVRLDRNKLTMNGRRQARELWHQGQELLVEQLEHVPQTAQAGEKAIQSSQA